MALIPGSGSPTSLWRRLSPRVRHGLLAVLGVFVLAAVILIGSALSKPHFEDPPDTKPTASSSSDLFRNAMDAVRSGDETRAVTLLEKVVSVDPANELARRELVKIKPVEQSGKPPAKAEDPKGGEDPDDPAPDADDAGFLQPVDDLASLLPKSVSGFELGAVYADDQNAEVTADPTGGSANVRYLSLFVHDFQTAEKAAAYPGTVMKSAFPKDESSVTVSGHAATFRTDGGMGAAVVLVRGRYVFEVLLTMEQYAPSVARDQGIAVAATFPTSL